MLSGLSHAAKTGGTGPLPSLCPAHPPALPQGQKKLTKTHVVNRNLARLFSFPVKTCLKSQALVKHCPAS